MAYPNTTSQSLHTLKINKVPDKDTFVKMQEDNLVNANELYLVEGDSMANYEETDPTVPSWAKASTKPSYTASEVGAAASSHTHGNITNSGDITASATIANGDRLVINDESASKITNSSITFGTSTSQYLANNGTWQSVPTVPTNISAFTNDSGFITTDEKVKQTAKSDNVNYKLLFTTSASPTSGNAAEAAYDTDITINPSTNTITATNFAGNATTATWATNLATHSSNEVTIGGSSGTATNNSVWINYRDKSGGSTTSEATQITNYYFGNRKGNTTGVTLNADNFSGNAATATTASKLGSSDLGSATKPIYLASGTATEGSTYAGGTAVTLNNSSKAASTASFYAPTTGGTQNTQALIGDGATAAPKWVNISPSISVTAGTASAAPKINVTVLGQSGTAQSITTATTGLYGVTKLNSATNSTSTSEAATPSAVKSAYDLANNHKYWADMEATSAATYNKTPEMATIKLNGNTSASAASTSNVTLVFDTVLQALNFVFA